MTSSSVLVMNLVATSSSCLSAKLASASPQMTAVPSAFRSARIFTAAVMRSLSSGFFVSRLRSSASTLDGTNSRLPFTRSSGVRCSISVGNCSLSREQVSIRKV